MQMIALLLNIHDPITQLEELVTLQGAVLDEVLVLGVDAAQVRRESMSELRPGQW